MVKGNSRCLIIVLLVQISVFLQLGLLVWRAGFIQVEFLVPSLLFRDHHDKCASEHSLCGEEQSASIEIDSVRLYDPIVNDTHEHDYSGCQNGREESKNHATSDNLAYIQAADNPQTSKSTQMQSEFSDSSQKRANVYHNWDLFQKDFNTMLQNFRIYVYPDVLDERNSFSKVFTPLENPLDPTLGNYFSEHMFKLNLLNSTFYTSVPEKAHMFFLPFSVNVLRNDPRVKTEESIANFVADYVKNVSSRFIFWNRTQGSDHFYACCHSVGRNAASKIPSLQRNSVQVVCSSNNYHKYYVPHKDVAMPQIWPRNTLPTATERTRLAFYAGRTQNSQLRERLVRHWQNDSDLDIHNGKISGSYEEAFQKTKFCLHVKGYEVNTARISDAIFFGCVPVIVSDQYDLPFANVLDWRKFSIIISHVDIPALKNILLSVTSEHYRELYENVFQVREHFQWHTQPSGYDSFHMIMYQLWLKQGVVHPFQIK